MKCKTERQLQEAKAARWRITNKVRRSIFKRYPAYPCAYCGRLLTREDATGDHIHPASLGGSNKRKNIAIACVDCNTRKGSMPASEFRKLLQQESH